MRKVEKSYLFSKMAKIEIINKPGEVVGIYKKIIRDRKNLSLSYGARFLHCLLRTIQEMDKWHPTVTGLAKEMGASRTTVIKFMKELKSHKLLEMQKIPNTPNSFNWFVYPIPKDEYEKRINGLT